jgi:filamentous hemagglutinin family protein
MKPKRFFFRSTTLFGAPLRYGAPVFIGFTVLVSGLDVHAGDLLRGGAGGSGAAPSQVAGTSGTSTPASSTIARANALDALARTTRSVDAVRAIQTAARSAAVTSSVNHLTTKLTPPAITLPDVPNGLGVGGLQVSADPTQWTGANLPTQLVDGGKTKVTIKQTTQQALLNWQNFNVGKETALTFDQSAGGENVSQWIAFNKVSDPTGNPSQILGSIKADGQVYVINGNGVIFGGSSQVNARGLTVSSLPINTNLIERGLLNNPDAQFLFSGLNITGGADGTPNFTPEPPPTSGHYGDVTVQAGAVLQSPASSGGNGGRIMLVGPNVTNDGTISTESGQTVLAAGLQVGVAAHNGNDPSLRGLDVWVGAVGDYAGTATNSGIIQALTGDTWMTGRYVNQLGVIDSSTSVSLNGRIDLKASYGAVANPNFDSTTEQGAGGPMFFNQYTGVVTLGDNSATRILPDYLSTKAVPGITLPGRSQVNIEGLAIHFDKKSTLLAPNAEVSVRAGVWPYKDNDGNRTIFDTAGQIESGINNYYSGSNQRFFFQDGQIYLDDAAVINVAGSVDVFVPLAQSILDVQLRGAELADSPLQRDTTLRGQTLTVDIRNTGTYNGKYWVGTPLGDVTGLAGLIERNASQLTAVGGNINLQAGGSIVVSKGAILDVSGGFFNYEGGVVKTSTLVSGGKIVDIKDANPDQLYDGLLTGETTIISDKWGVKHTIMNPLFAGTVQDSYVDGAAGGSLTLTAASMAIDGDLRGLTVAGPRQRNNLPGLSSLHLNFQSEKTLLFSGNLNYITNSPTPPAITFSLKPVAPSIPTFSLVGDSPVSLSAERLTSVNLSTGLLGPAGFGNLDIVNPDGSITVPAGERLSATPKGSISLTGATISILGHLDAAGGNLSFNTFNISPTAAAEYNILNPVGSALLPTPNSDRGIFTLSSGGSLSTAVKLVDDSGENLNLSLPKFIDGGNITIRSYQASLAQGAEVNVSGSAYISEIGKVTYGNGGNISLLTGKDFGFPGVIGGGLVLNSTLSGYSGAVGGSLSIQTGRIQIGGTTQADAINLGADFFSKGGFTKYSLTGIGAAGSPTSGLVESYLPAISIAAGSRINPIAESLIAVPDSAQNGAIVLQRIVDSKGVRAPVSLSFSALGSDDPFTLDQLEVRGDIVMGAGAQITTDAGANVSFKGGTVTLLGSVIAPGGIITVAGAGAFPLTTSQRMEITEALPTAHLGAEAELNAAGIIQLVPDVYGRRIGKVYNGGAISISGNILTESGSVLDVTGASGVLDLDPATLANVGTAGNAGLNSTPYQLRNIATRVDSNGGLIDLTGSQMLLSDATLRGAAGGATAIGGQLSVSSGNYYREGQSRTGADVNLVVKQSGNAIVNPTAIIGVGIGLFDQNRLAYGNTGFFAMDRFQQGAFDSLSLGGKYIASASPIPYGGNIDFQGKIDIQAHGSVRLAAGGVIQANDTVNISGSYISVGQEFRAPQNPDDSFIAFQQDPANPSAEYKFAPTYGAGDLKLSADLIDVGTLSLQNIGHASLSAVGGDIRGNGTLSLAGDLVLKAGQVYPTTLGNFNIFAYDHSGNAGSVTILSSGTSVAPLSAGGSLTIDSSNIFQGGVLRAPLGSIRLGWDGTDIDLSDSDLDKPVNLIAGLTIETPKTLQVGLLDQSVTSVTAKGLQIPFGISPDGLTWIDPRGVNVTLSGLPSKSVVISADSVNMNAGAKVDISGGGDLLATRWVPGNGGSMDLLGTASAAWGAGAEYQPGALVTYGGSTWSARVRGSGQTPGSNLYWSKVAESYAIVPSFGSQFSPYGAYNTGPNSSSLAGAPGYVSGSLKVGDSITLEASSGLVAGTYTLLPRGYAVLQGAYLVTPVANHASGTINTADGASIVSGYIANSFNLPVETSAVRSRFEVASAAVVKSRVSYAVYSANDFISKSGSTQLTPQDAGYAAFQGNVALQLEGSLLTQAAGRGAMVDINSASKIFLTGGNASAPSGSSVTLQTDVLNSWGVNSLLIGGIRSVGAAGTTIDVRTDSLTLDNPGDILSGPEIIFASRGELKVTDSSSIVSTGSVSRSTTPLLIQGDGTLLRVSSDPAASVTRTGLVGSSSPLMTVGANSQISGPSVILDSTYGTILSPLAKIEAGGLTLGSGQISVVFDGASAVLDGSVVSPHLTLAGVTLAKAQESKALTLQSYRSIDFYGAGRIGGATLEKITLSGSGLRGYQQGSGNVTIQAKDVTFVNPVNGAVSNAPVNQSGSLTIDAGIIHLGANAITVAGYQDLSLNASDRIVFDGTGAFSTTGNLLANTRLITGAKASSYTMSAAQAVTLASSGVNPTLTDDLGASLTIQGTRIAANTNILLPSGQLTLRATAGPLEVGGNLSVAGTSRAINDLTRFSDGGSITLESVTGDVTLAAGSNVSVAAAPSGGSAGSINLLATQGSFVNAGSLHGEAGTTGTAGSFLLDVKSLDASGLASFNAISTALDGGGFYTSRNFRIRNGDVVINNANRSHAFTLSADRGGISVTGSIDASGTTGGSIALAAHNNLTLAAGSNLSVAAQRFDSAGKGGSILLEAGTQLDGTANTGALLDLQLGSQIDLSVADYVAGDYTTVGSSAFGGKFTGTLHLRAPRSVANDDVRVDSIESKISGASSVVVEAYKIYTPSGGGLNIAQRNLINTDSISFLGASGIGNANEVAMRSKLLTGADNAAALDSVMVITPGVEILNLTGNLTLGLANNSSAGSTHAEALAGADWDLSGFRYGVRSAPGVLTLRASGDLVFNNTLSDGFAPIAQGTAQVFADNGNSLMWLAPLMTIKNTLPTNTQSWSYRLTAGADMTSSNFRSVLSASALDLAQPLKGSVIVGEFYPAVPNTASSGTAAATGSLGQTADTIRISATTTNKGNRFEVVRTGTGDITISAGRDVQLRNQFSTIYTAGVALPMPTTVYSSSDFVLPVTPVSVNASPSQAGGASGTLGSIQQLYLPAWSMAGGNVSITAQANIGHYTMSNGVLAVDSSREMPTNWLYRRGYVDSATGLFASNGGFGTNTNIQNATNINDKATSTTWWVDYSNFFEGVGALGGGNVSLVAGNDVVNVDAVSPTNARMSGRVKNPDFGVIADAPEYLNGAPDANKLLELGGGDVTVIAGRNIDGGVYYVEKGQGSLFAGGEIKTNAARSPSLGILDGSAPLDPLTWLPTTLFVGKSQFDVASRGDVLLGPISNPFLLPQGINNKFWNKTYFNTYSADAGATVVSYGGDVTHRMSVNLPEGASPRSVLDVWYNSQGLFAGVGSAYNASNYQPWLRLSELGLTTFSSVFALSAPNLRSTSFGGDLNLAGSWTLFPSATGNLELAASSNIMGLQKMGPGFVNGKSVQVWSASRVNLSDASPSSLPGITSPLGYQAVVGRTLRDAVQSGVDILKNVSLALNETGSTQGLAATSAVKQALHAPEPLHAGDKNAVRLYAAGGDITGLTLFSPKATQIMAQRDITDIAFYLQNVSSSDISLVSAGRDLIPFAENSTIRSIANNLTLGNAVGDNRLSTASGDSTSSLAGDIQINGPGVMEVLSGRNIDLGTGANFTDGTGVGITSIGNLRNLNLPFTGADLIVLSGVSAPGGFGQADGLALSSMDIDAFINKYLSTGTDSAHSAYLKKIGWQGQFSDLSAEQKAIVALEKYYQILRDAGRGAAEAGNYDAGYTAVTTLFGTDKPVGDILTQARDIRTTSGGSISLGAVGGGITMASAIFGNPLTPPGIVTEYGGAISTFTDKNVSIGQARIFTLRGGDITMWSSTGNIAAGTSAKTVVTAPPTRVVINVNSADVQTDLGGLATGGGIGVLASVEGIKAGNVDLVAPKGYVDAGDAGIRVTGNLNIAAQVVLNSSNIASGGTSTGTNPGAVSAPSVASVTSASNSGAAASAAVTKSDPAKSTEQKVADDVLSIFTVEVIGYGGGSVDDDAEKDKAP